MVTSTTSPSSQPYEDKPFVRKRRPRRHVSTKDPHAHVIGCCALVASSFFLVLLYKAQEILDSVVTQTDFRLSANVLLGRRKKSNRKAQRKFPSAASSKYQPPSDFSKPPPSKFLIFNSELPGQGMGNVVSGLLSAHLLALEFDRLLCPKYPMLFEAFELAHPWAIARCPSALRELDAAVGRGEAKSISMVTFDAPPDECHLKKVLSSEATFVIMFGNTYPRWPAVPDNFFFIYYRPRKELLEALPYDPESPPSTIVHLRAPDGSQDPRLGLDDESLKALADALPSDTYLVTNRVEWYDFFETKGWRHPGWNKVQHSANWNAYWGERQRDAEHETSQTLQMWADWYVMLTADRVYHTHSDFSVSAIHWMNLDSLSLQGMENGHLKMVNESWRVDGETAPLVDRTVDGEGTSNLRMCASR